ncbi:MAG: hypothetical protein ACR2IV_06835 [Bryobacteraceae bacterium]
MIEENTTDRVAHARSEFRFSVDLPYDVTAPLFGALEEQKWAPEWKPQFLYPDPPADQEGAVFRVDYSPSQSSIWTTSVFDLASGHIQYVLVLDHVVLTRIDIRLASASAQKTDVSVVYERTAIHPNANEDVRNLASEDAAKGEEWKAAIDAYGMTLKAAHAEQRRE